MGPEDASAKAPKMQNEASRSGQPNAKVKREKTEAGQSKRSSGRRYSLTRRRSKRPRPSFARKPRNAKGKVKRECLVKQEPGDNNEGLGKKDKVWDPIQHFTHQMAVVQQYIPAGTEWERFLGSLGTGILGARAKAAGQKSQDAAAVKTEKTDSFIFLFLNAAAGRLQEWNGKVMSGFTDCLNRKAKTLRWESQRNDKTGRVIAQIIEHTQQGAEVVVAVRASPGDSFSILGKTRNFGQDSAAQFLLEPGDHLIGERGSQRMHKCITAQCIDAGLKMGIGLVPQQFPLPERTGRVQFCTACCWKPATAIIRFDAWNEVAADILDKGATLKAADPRLPDVCGKRRRIKREQTDNAVTLPVKIKKEQQSSGFQPTGRRRWPANVIVIAEEEKVVCEPESPKDICCSEEHEALKLDGACLAKTVVLPVTLFSDSSSA